ncbi:MAG TPA: hypothetical protein VNJ02_20170 [Vicinamibacterales bacterium]|nr:hypothetical protein [Vicinamibacterales bacterium]
MDNRADHQPPTDLSRRHMLQTLATLGITGPLAVQFAAQPGAQLSADVIRQASIVLGEAFTPQRVAVIEKALRRNLEQLQVVRDLVIDDWVEPAPMFMARSHGGLVSAPGKAK